MILRASSGLSSNCGKKVKARVPQANVAATGAKEKALSYALNRSGGRAGEMHFYNATRTLIEQTIPIDGRERR